MDRLADPRPLWLRWWYRFVVGQPPTPEHLDERWQR